MAKGSFIMEGMQSLRKFIKDLPLTVTKRAEVAMLQVGEDIMKESQKIVPVDTGALKESALPPKISYSSKRRVEMILAYGMYRTVPGYALYVHERTDLHHDPPTQAKYLSRPAMAKKRELNHKIYAEILDALSS